MRFDFECLSICLSAHLSSLLRFFFPSCCQSIHHVYTFLYIITSQYHHPISRLLRSFLYSASDSHFLHNIINSTLSFPLPLPLLYLYLYVEQNHTVFFSEISNSPSLPRRKPISSTDPGSAPFGDWKYTISKKKIKEFKLKINSNIWGWVKSII